MSSSAAESTPGPRARKSTGDSTTFTCPECGRTFGRAQALGAHRSRAHGVAGASRRGRARKSGSGRPTAKRTRAAASRPRTTASRASDGRGFDRDQVLGALFPQGVPAKASVIEALGPWLEEAERLARMR